MEPSKQALAQLKDIHLPSPISWWPLAPGWWLLIVIAVSMLSSVAWYLWKRIKADQVRKQALRLLTQYQLEAQKEKNSAQICSKVSELLRRVALAYYPRAQVASLKGDAWVAFLNTHAKNCHFDKLVSHFLNEVAYQAQSNADLGPLFKNARAWIQERRHPW